MWSAQPARRNIKPCQVRQIVAGQGKASEKKINFADLRSRSSSRQGSQPPANQRRKALVDISQIKGAHLASDIFLHDQAISQTQATVAQRGGRHGRHLSKSHHSLPKTMNLRDSKFLIKQQEFYFQQRPTCLKQASSSDSTPDHKKQRTKKVSYARQLLYENTSSDEGKKKTKYVVKNPYYEDKESYNLDACIQERRKPIFGYMTPTSVSDKSRKEQGIDLDLLKPSVIAMKREKQFMEHVLKCFTWGKPVRRDTALIDDAVSKIGEFRKQFNRVRLIRRFFSIKRRNLNRKFDYPIDQLGRIMHKIIKKQDYQQYCIESDFEHEYPRLNKHQSKQLKEEVKELKRQHYGIFAPTEVAQFVSAPSVLNLTNKNCYFGMEGKSNNNVSHKKSSTSSSNRKRREQTMMMGAGLKKEEITFRGEDLNLGGSSSGFGTGVGSNVVKHDLVSRRPTIYENVDGDAQLSKELPSSVHHNNRNSARGENDFLSGEVVISGKNHTATTVVKQPKFHNEYGQQLLSTQISIQKQSQHQQQKTEKGNLDLRHLQVDQKHLMTNNLSTLNASPLDLQPSINLFKRGNSNSNLNDVQGTTSARSREKNNLSSGYFGSQKSSVRMQQLQQQRVRSGSGHLQQISTQRVSQQRNFASRISDQDTGLLYDESISEDVKATKRGTIQMQEQGGKSSGGNPVSSFAWNKGDDYASSRQFAADQDDDMIESNEVSQGYYSGREFGKIRFDDDKSYCSSVANAEQDELIGKDHLFQPFDFFTSRKTKQFFKEDFVNLTQAVTNKEYIRVQQKREVNRTYPELQVDLIKSQAAYERYLDKINRSRSPKDKHTVEEKNPYRNVRPNSPAWKALQKRFKTPEIIKVQMENSLTKEVPEVSQDARQINQVPLLKVKVNKGKIRREYRQFFNNRGAESDDSEYEQKNLQQYLKKKRDKGASAKSVLEKVEKRLQKKDSQVFTQYGQRSQHLQLRDRENRITQLTFQRSLPQQSLTEKRQRLQKVQQFKHGLSQDQMQVLKDRQFVIVDQAQLQGRRNILMRKQKEQIEKQKMALSSAAGGHFRHSALKSTTNNETTPTPQRSQRSLESKTVTPLNRSIVSIEYLEKEQEEDLRQLEQREQDTFVEIKSSLVKQTEAEAVKNVIKNSEFNRDVRRNYNRYKRMIRDKLQKQQEEADAQQQQQHHQLLVVATPIKEEETSKKSLAIIKQDSQDSGKAADGVKKDGVEGRQLEMMTSEFAYGSTTLQQSSSQQEITARIGDHHPSLDKSMTDLNSSPFSGAQKELTQRSSKMETRSILEADSSLIKATANAQGGVAGARNHKHQNTHLPNFQFKAQSQTQLEINTRKKAGPPPSGKIIELYELGDAKRPIRPAAAAPTTSITSERNRQPVSKSRTRVQSSEYFHVQKIDGSGKNSHRSQGPSTYISSTETYSQSAYKHIPSERLSPVGNMVNHALRNVPKIPSRFDRSNSEVVGIEVVSTGKRAQKARKDSAFSKFMLERLKKNSILNHAVFKNNDLGMSKHKQVVALNYRKYQQIIHKGSLSANKVLPPL